MYDTYCESEMHVCAMTTLNQYCLHVLAFCHGPLAHAFLSMLDDCFVCLVARDSSLAPALLPYSSQHCNGSTCPQQTHQCHGHGVVLTAVSGPCAAYMHPGHCRPDVRKYEPVFNLCGQSDMEVAKQLTGRKYIPFNTWLDLSPDAETSGIQVR